MSLEHSLLVLVVLVLLGLWKEVKRMTLDLSKLNQAVSENTAAVQAAIAAGIGQGGSTTTDQAGVDAAAAQIVQNNQALATATPAPAPTPTPVTP